MARAINVIDAIIPVYVAVIVGLQFSVACRIASNVTVTIVVRAHVTVVVRVSV